MKINFIKWLFSFFILFSVSAVAYADTNNMGQKLYNATCQRCHSPQLAAGIKAPPAFDKHAWRIRYAHAQKMAKQYPDKYKTAWDYLLTHVKMGRGLMAHGGLCKESGLTTEDCSDKNLLAAIKYMSGIKN